MTADPRRCRTAVCPALLVDGRPATPPALAGVGIVFAGTTRRLDAKVRAATWHCTIRRQQLIPGYVSDICLSSWGAGCPWAAGLPSPWWDAA